MLPPVMGSLLEYTAAAGVPPLRIYVSGDTLTGAHLGEIAERVGPIDVAVVHLGGTRVLLRTVTMDAEQGVDAVRRLLPGCVVPVHTDDYRAFRSGLRAFEDAARAAGLAGLLRPVSRGDSLDLTPASIGSNHAE